MPDQRLIEYIRQNLRLYPVETLRATLLKSGYDARDVEEALSEAQAGQVAPPSQIEADALTQPAADQPVVDAIQLSPSNLIESLSEMVGGPTKFFSRLKPECDLWQAALYIWCWSLVAGIIAISTTLIKGAPTAELVGVIVGVVIFSILNVPLNFVNAGVYHVACIAVGGKATYRGSFHAMTALHALNPFWALFSVVPLGQIPVACYSFFLTVKSAVGMHKIRELHAWLLFCALACVFIGITVGIIVFVLAVVGALKQQGAI
ncbi:hypothetical protein ACFL2T_03380 [Elusimicrobiota bacterium]